MVLAFACEWHQRRLPFPVRPQIVQWLGVSVSCLQSTLSRQLLEGHLKVEVTAIPSAARTRPGQAVLQRHYVPSDELLDAYFGQRLWRQEARRA